MLAEEVQRSGMPVVETFVCYREVAYSLLKLWRLPDPGQFEANVGAAVDEFMRAFARR